MDSCKCFIFILTVTCLMSTSVSSARLLPFRPLIPNFINPNTTTHIEHQLQGNDQRNINPLDCLNALSEVRSCTNEIMAYFTNGTIDISPVCCKSITIITHRCWPTMLSSLGFTQDQTYVLRGYCDASASNAATYSSPAPSPIP